MATCCSGLDSVSRLVIETTDAVQSVQASVVFRVCKVTIFAGFPRILEST